MIEAVASRREIGSAEILTFNFVLRVVNEHETLFDHFLLSYFEGVTGNFREIDIQGINITF